ncbi:MAG: carboxypeptidase regulatory-like domain-containing protein [Oligoflexia bacterium]|nr:carboxypeptidase regulatory-like domain-containing protein [Oligoflexia bacterium]
MKQVYFLTITFFIFIISFSITALATTSAELYITMPYQLGDDLHKLRHILSLAKIKDNKIFAFIKPSRIKALQQLGYQYTLLDNPSEIARPKMLSVLRSKNSKITKNYDIGNENEGEGEGENRDEGIDENSIDNINTSNSVDGDFVPIAGYPTYSAYENFIKDLANKYPTLCRLSEFGKTPKGHTLYMLKITESVNQNKDKPAILYSGAIHGNEVVGYVLMLNLADYLLSKYNSDSRVRTLLNNSEIWINPLFNPDGTYYRNNNTVSGSTRSNSNGVDLNRNFPDPKEGDHPDGSSWQPETLALMDFLKQKRFVMAADFHGGAELVNYPWDTYQELHPDDAWFRYISRAYVDYIHNTFPQSSYMKDEDNGITNGYAWYEINGGRQDYLNVNHHTKAVTIEVSSDFIPNANQLSNFWQWNLNSLLTFAEQASLGIRGKVTDAKTGAGIKATIEIPSYDDKGSWVESLPSTGNFYRPIIGGTYSIKVSAPGYETKTISGISVQNGEAKEVNIQL